MTRLGGVAFPYLGCDINRSIQSLEAAGTDGRATTGVANGSLLRVEKRDRQFWALDVSIVTEAGKSDRWYA
jgi:hypothetical protein